MSDNDISEMPPVVQSILLLLYVKFPTLTAEQLFRGMLQVMSEIYEGHLTFRLIRHCVFINDKGELYFDYNNIPEYSDDEYDSKNNGCCEYSDEENTNENVNDDQ